MRLTDNIFSAENNIISYISNNKIIVSKFPHNN